MLRGFFPKRKPFFAKKPLRYRMRFLAEKLKSNAKREHRICLDKCGMG